MQCKYGSQKVFYIWNSLIVRSADVCNESHMSANGFALLSANNCVIELKCKPRQPLATHRNTAANHCKPLPNTGIRAITGPNYAGIRSAQQSSQQSVEEISFGSLSV